MRPERGIYTIPLRLRSLFRRKRADQELDEELRYHVEQKTVENVEKGMTQREARRAALVELRGLERTKDECRDARRVTWLQDLAQDLRYGLRMLRKSPGFTSVAVLTLALGIGANTAIFSVLDAVLLKSLPYPDPQKLVLVWGVDTSDHSDRDQVSATDVMDWRKQNNVFEDIATYGNWTPALTGHGEARRVPAMLVGDGYFKIMQARPFLGRTFTPEENIDGKDREVVLSYGFWRADMDGDPNIVGKSLILNGSSHTIVGVLPQSFRSLLLSLLTGPAAQIYRPVGENYDNKMRSARHLRAIARLKPRVTVAEAQADMSVITQRLAKQYPADNTNYSARVVPMKEDLVGGLRPALLILFGAVGFVLLIACANVANLLLARGSIRQREVAVRAALGASRERLLRQFLAEGVLLALAGGAAGVLLAEWTTAWITRLGGESFPALSSASMDVSVLLFTFVIALLTSILFGLAPAERAARLNVSRTLKEGSRSFGTTGSNRMRDLLVVIEMALALVLVIGAGLMIRSVVSLYGLNPGFSPDHLLTMDLSLPAAKYPKISDRIAFYQTLGRKVESLPGVESTGTTSVLPLSGNFDGRAFQVFDHPRPRGQEYSADYYAVAPGYFRAMKISLREGRLFTDGDRETSAPVVIVDETLARTIWPGEDPIGKRVRAPGQVPLEKEPWSTVVGVVSDVKQWALDRPGTMQLYGPEWQVGFGWATLVVRTKTDPSAAAASVRSLIRSLDPDQAVANVTTMDEIISSSIALRRLAMWLMTSFAGLALLLACVGVYGVMSYSVEQRRQEIGVRLALGAQPRDVLRLAIGRGTRLALTGVGIGVLAAGLLTRLMSSLLYGISPTDPVTFAGVAILLTAVAIAACYLPARRAMRVDPMVALRHE
jgi:putative ABC transport system permease protein